MIEVINSYIQGISLKGLVLFVWKEVFSCIR